MKRIALIALLLSLLFTACTSQPCPLYGGYAQGSLTVTLTQETARACTYNVNVAGENIYQEVMK